MGDTMFHIIINPASKSGKGEKIWKEIRRELIRRNVIYKEYFTRQAGDAESLVKKLTTSLEETISIIVLGGDGTLNEAVNGIQNFELTHLSYIPTGSSNDFVRDMKIPAKPLDAIKELLDDAQHLELDVGELTYEAAGICYPGIQSGDTVTRKFIVSSDVGFGAAVCEQALHSKMKTFLNHIKLGKLTYIGIALTQLLKGPKVKCVLKLDDGREISFPQFLLIVGMIHRYEGGGIQFCPKADYQDGLFDICSVGKMSRMKMLFMLPSAYSGNHLRYKQIDAYRSKTVEVTMEAPVWVHTDGEVVAQTKHAVMRSLPEKLNLYY